MTGPVDTPEDDASEDIAANTSGYPTDELLDCSINDSTGVNENPFHALPENRDVTPIPEENPFKFVPENQGVTPIPEIPETEFIPENRRVAPIPEPDLHDRHVTPISEENPFDFVSENCGIAPTPDLHLHGDDGGPSEPIAWAFQRQGLGDGSAIDSRTSSLGAFGGHSPPPRSTSKCPTVVTDRQGLLQSSPVGSTPEIDVGPEPRSSPLGALREERHHYSLPATLPRLPALLPSAISDDRINPDLLRSTSAVSITSATPPNPRPIDCPASPMTAARTITLTSDHPLTTISVSRPQS